MRVKFSVPESMVLYTRNVYFMFRKNVYVTNVRQRKLTERPMRLRFYYNLEKEFTTLLRFEESVGHETFISHVRSCPDVRLRERKSILRVPLRPDTRLCERYVHTCENKY